MSRDWRRTLRSLHRRTARRTPDSPSWDDTLARARELAMAARVVDTVGVSFDELLDAGIDRLPSDVAEALARLAPNFDIDTIASYPPAALDGLGNAVKGALFELEVADAIANGDLALPEGADAIRIVDDFATPGFDLEVLDGDGGMIDLVQLKTSQSADIIAEHLANHPEIDSVWTSHEAAVDAAERGIDGVVDTQISDLELTSEVSDALADQASTSFGEVFDEIVPQVTYAIIAAQACWQMWQGAPVNEVLISARRRAGNATALSAVAGLASMATGTDAVRIPVVIGVSVGRAAYVDIDGSAQRLRLMAATASRLRPA